jgi:hypothetical protein
MSSFARIAGGCVTRLKNLFTIVNWRGGGREVIYLFK